MNLKTIKVLLFTLLALTLASFLIGCGVSKPVYFLFTALFAIGYAAVWLLCWRCPFCGERLGRSDGETCPHCGKSFAGRNPGGILPVGTVLAGRYTVGEMLSIDGEGILYRGAENLGRFRVTIKEYLPITLTAERTVGSVLRPKTGSEVLFKTTRMDFADLYHSIQRITPANGLEAVLDVVETNNTVYAVLENPGGTPLDQWLENHPGPIRPDDACAMLQPVFEGVAAMHKIGLVHRGI